MNETRLTRRRLLRGTAGLTAIGLAGCTGSSGGSAGGSTASPSSSAGGGDHAGHGESEHGHGSVGEPKDAREVAVNTARGGGTTEYHFKPHVTRVTVGGTVTWRLESGTHTATAYHPGNDEPRLVPEGTEAWDSGTLSEKGATFEHTFEKEGVYHYFCKPHEQFGMLGTVVVGDPHPDEQVALQTIPEDKPEEVRQKLKQLNEMVRSALEGGHHGGESTETGHHEDDGHHGTETTETGHHEDGDHHGTETTETDHHEDTTTDE